MGADQEPTSRAAAELDDIPERASEIDDITDSFVRPADDTDAGDDVEPGADADGGADVDAGPDLPGVDVAAVLAERDEYLALAQRIQAEYDNHRKRSAARALDDADRASGRLAEALLPVLDAAEAAYVNHPDEVGPLLNQMLGELRKHGLETMDLEGKAFDPELAEAVSHEPGDGGEPVVTEVFRSGYLWKGKVLRAAMVKTKD